MLERPVIRKQFTNRYARILELLNMEVSTVEILFNRGSRGALINLPPLAAALTFTNMLRQRIDLPIQSFKAMPYPYVSNFFSNLISQVEKEYFVLSWRKLYEEKNK